jgi:regulation of enolase protein 1 (concanavalin A-like superfamily)
MRLRAFSVLSLFVLCSSVLAQDPATVGQWSPVMTWPYEAIHAHLLPTGKVIFWDRGDHSQLWDPTTNAVNAATPSGANIFCSGHAFLPNGQIFVTGGHISNFVGLRSAYLYRPADNIWTQLPDMNDARWYPTNTTLPNGDMLVISGWINTTTGVNVEAQVWQTATASWRNLSTADLALPFYPFMFDAPNGKVFCAGPSKTTRYLDVTGTGSWTSVADSNYGTRNWGSAVMYDDGKVLLMGGNPCDFYAKCGTLPTATAETIDLNSPSPAWQYTSPMVTGGRKLHNATLLPDGKVLITGGSRGSEDPNTQPTNPAYESEMWDPATGTWTQMASITTIRSYHSTALLLPDARVLSAGGDFGRTSAEIYSPPYLFNGARPTITSAPTNVTYGQSFFVATPDAASISSVTLIALSSVTHGFNMSQRINRPAFSQASGGLNITAPSNANTTPPGYYMLFILKSGVPSVASIVRIDATLNPAPTPSWTIPITVQTNPAGLSFTVDGNTYNAAQTFSWTPGSNHTIATTSPQNGGAGVRFVWQNWSGGGTISQTVAPTTKTTYTAKFGTQYYLTTGHGTGGTVSPASGWKSNGAVVSITATPNSGYTFSGWTGSGTGSYSGTNTPASITMSGPISETAAFTSNVTPTPTSTPTPTATPQNAAPVVNAGPDQTVAVPSATLNGSASDDGLPNPPGALTYTWSTVNGPGTVSFADATAPNTTASFSQSGVYTLRLTAYDGAASGSDDVVVTVNQAPVVNAGPDQTVAILSATLTGSATDDGLPNPPGTLNYTWSIVDGPGTVSFADASAPNTSASFSQSGVYTLRLTAYDGAASSSDDLVITINQPPVVNLGPTNAGPALAIALSDPANLNGSATDDGFPNPPGTLTYNWTTVSGPAAVTFANANAASTTATFSGAGNYTLRLTASDSALSGSSDLTVLVGGPLPSPWMDQDIGAVGIAGRGSFLTGTFIERGSGADIGGSADAFHYIYQPLNGNGTMIVRIATQYNSDSSAKAGVMIRETLSAGSKYAAVVITPSNQIIFQRRTKTNGTTGNTTATGTQLVVPYWLKLTRTGNSLASYYSSDGVTWTSGGTASVTMASSVFVGLAVTSHSAFSSTLTIDHVNMAPIANAGPDQSITLPTNTVTLNGSATDDGQPNGSITYSWKKLAGPGKVTFGNASQAVSTAQFSKAGTYTLQLTANDGQLSATDNVVITVLNPTP